MIVGTSQSLPIKYVTMPSFSWAGLRVLERDCPKSRAVAAGTETMPLRNSRLRIGTAYTEVHLRPRPSWTRHGIRQVK